jgi:hypothetical protein
MPLTLRDIIRIRPFLYHLTDARNLDRIIRTRMLEPASLLAKAAGREDLLTIKRHRHVELLLESESIFLRDQAPLHAGNMKLSSGWDFERFVRALNERVFFWPGSEAGPIDYGVRHFNRYEAEAPSILRVSLASLVEENDGIMIELCRYNSGSPRWSRGIAAPRGRETFVAPNKATFSASEIVEVAVKRPVRLPADVEVGAKPRGPWRPGRRLRKPDGLSQ